MIQTLLIYTLLAFLMAFFVQKSLKHSYNKRISSFFFILSMLLFAIIFGMRYGVGIDYYTYSSLYEDWDGDWIDSTYSRLEPAYLFIVNFCHKLSLSNVWYFSILAFLQIFFLFMAFRENKEVLPFISIVLIFSGIAMVGFMNGIRQSIAFCIFIFAVQYIDKQKMWKYFLFITLACLFHKSAVILFPLYFLWRIRSEIFKNIYIQVILLIICFAMIFFNPLQTIIGYVDDLIKFLEYDVYLDSEKMYGERAVGFMNILQFLVYVVIILYSNKMKSYFNSKKFNILYDLFLIGIYANYIFMGSMMFGRIILYFTYVNFIILGYTSYYFYKNWRYSIANIQVFGLILIFIFASFGRVMTYMDENTTQYVFYFQKELHAIKDHQFEQFLMDNATR